ncbi:hypothetical protein BGC33_08115 [Bathymodiolus thermophilus thioautotrophic gill symbiont]|uniref:SHSP domain-containing protein n=2 Tax=Bathymodiolus thermophilus thioautotrophic gill symbiont TaxID=2360 RepID=A0A1J5U5X0_9GAMM|nr:hypothetical protein BGC33_08115 [Bathymodiolus thermophilus thioautotrophic gill symbiont]
MMKKTLAIITLLASTTLSAHDPYHSNFFNHSMLNKNFWSDFHQQFQQFDHQINKLQHSGGNIQSKQYFDKNNNNYVVEIKALGFNKSDVNISNTQNTLTIKGYKKTSNKKNTHSESSFSHVLTLPMDGDTNNIVADLKNGILKVSIPKLKQPKPQSRKIHIQ